MHPKRKTIGMRVPDNRIALAMLELLDEPLMSVTMILPGEDLPLTDPEDMCRLLGHAVDVVVDGGGCGLEPTTVVDLAGPAPAVVRRGKGETQAFE
jgi:tRNA A37 threonylcarbamoyladenosine synthetase subunit TsaC/SUA5/YrdC